MLTMTGLAMAYGNKLLFEGANLNLVPGRRYGIVGANGCGKSTLLKLIMGEEESTFGEVTRAKRKTVGWLKQDQFLHNDSRIIDVVIQGKTELWEALHEKETLLQGDDWSEENVHRLGELEETIARCDGYSAEALAHTLLTGLGINNEDHFKPLSILSGGYKLRVLLAQALFNNPDILLLDEPTNHLDIMTIAWLESYLKKDYQGLLMFISHDHNFLNGVATDILDIDYGEIIQYVGNYDYFLQEKKLVAEQRLHQRGHLEARIAELQRFVDRFKAKPSKAKQAQSKAKMIERIELPDVKKSSRVHPQFRFVMGRPSGKKVLTVKSICKSFGERQVLKDISFQIHRGDKVALIGHNGVGKSTLLKIATNHLAADSGEHEWGHETQVAYFAQDHHEQLHGSQSVLKWLGTHSQNKTDMELRKALGQMLFTQDDVEKSIQSLSGGEAARLCFARIMLEKPNVLVLDEPTNHLDLESIEALSKALESYEGTVIFVSHDRHFVGLLAQRVIALTEKGVNDYHGSYKEYSQKFGEDYLSQVWLKQAAST